MADLSVLDGDGGNDEVPDGVVGDARLGHNLLAHHLLGNNGVVAVRVEKRREWEF